MTEGRKVTDLRPAIEAVMRHQDYVIQAIAVEVSYLQRQCRQRLQHTPTSQSERICLESVMLYKPVRSLCTAS